MWASPNAFREIETLLNLILCPSMKWYETKHNGKAKRHQYSCPLVKFGEFYMLDNTNAFNRISGTTRARIHLQIYIYFSIPTP